MKGQLMKFSNLKFISSTILFGSLSLIAINNEKITQFIKEYNDLKEHLTYPLYKNEVARCKNKSDSIACREEENTEFLNIGKEVLKAQQKITNAQVKLNESIGAIKAVAKTVNNIHSIHSIQDLITNIETLNKLSLLKDKNNANSNQLQHHRVFHAKQHACLTATLRLTTEEERKKQLNSLYTKINPNETLDVLNRGIFKTSNVNSPREYKAIIRFSSGLGIIYHDLIPDVKGLAIKLLDVSDGEKKKTVDLLMTSGPNPFGNNLRDFADFMNATTSNIEFSPLLPPLNAAVFINSKKAIQNFDHNETQKVPNRSSINSLKSLSRLQYWSGHPYLMRSDSKPNIETAMKFNVLPQKNNEIELYNETGEKADENTHLKPNHLREDLIGRFSLKQSIKYDFNIQLEKNPNTTPIESTVVEWEEKNSPSIKVGELIIEPQIFNKPEIDKFCDESNFTPAHYHSQHRPLSNMGRGRIVAYKASQLGRAIKDVIIDDLTLDDYKKIKALNNASSEAK